MKVNKVIIYILFGIMLNGCSTKNVDFLYSKVDTKNKVSKIVEVSFQNDGLYIYNKVENNVYKYYDKNHQFQKEHSLNEYYKRERKKFYNEVILKDILIINLPNVIEGSYTKSIFGKKIPKKKTLKENVNFIVYISHKDLLTDNIKKNLKIYLDINNKIYKPIVDDEKYIYTFPIQIKDVIQHY